MGAVQVTRAGRLQTITLNDPQRRNPLSLSVLNELTDAISNTPANIGVVVIEAAGPVFSAGHDLKEMIDRTSEFYDELFAACTTMMMSIQAIPQPVIAKVGGPATAAGCQLVASCDLAVAADDAWFATPGVKIGLFCSTPMVPVAKAVGRKRAMLMLLTGEPVPAARAAEWGLINMAVPSDELDDAVDTLCEKVLSFSSDTIGRGKTAFYSQVDQDMAEAYRRVQPVMAANAASDDAQEGITAFLGKRPPEWSDHLD